MEATLICPNCHAANDASARFCASCGTALAAPAPATADVRKVVTVLFCDIADSTPLGEALDPESLRRLLGRYFTEMNGVLQRHGGTAEKYIGDAIMAVFGVPQLHEDDAQRAARAAVEMRRRIAELNEDFDRTWGVRISTRMGVNTGEVIAGDPTQRESFVLGDVANVAARLEQTAEPGEILIGESTYRLVRDVATVEPLGPLNLKGKAEPVRAWRLVDIAAAAPRSVRGLDSPLIGRDRELAQVREAFRRTVDGRTCELVTVIGAAGTGKSRLSNELVSDVGDEARVLVGHCLPYGEGITFLPIVEVVRAAAGIDELDTPDDTRAKIAQLVVPDPDSALIAERVEALLGLSDVAPGIQETFWAVRKLLEQLAARRPLVLVLDDIHWGEPTFLDLVEYLADWIRAVPVLILCMSRPELLELRGGWMMGKANASAIVLRPLSGAETNKLIQNLLGGADLGGHVRARIADVAEGNPLFVEETLRMLVDDGLLQGDGDHWSASGDLSQLTIPPTIHALLTARLDRLEADERAVIERAAVTGRTFWWGAVSELSPPEQRPLVGRHLQSLARKELIRPEHSDLRDEDAFGFTHILIRDAAYRGIPKAARADLHERFADWIQAKIGDRVGEYIEIVGYHLEQAWRSLYELAPRSDEVEALGRRAAPPLATAGRRAFARGDMPAAVNLLSRALALGPERAVRGELLSELAFALQETGDFSRLQDVVAEMQEVAEFSSDPTLKAYTVFHSLWMAFSSDPEGWAEEARREATRTIATFAELSDEAGLAKGWSLLGLLHVWKCHFAAAEEAWEKAATHARAAENQREELEYLTWVPIAIWGGPTPVEEAIRRCEEVLERANGDRKAMATALFTQGKLEAMRGRYDVGRELVGRARALLEEIALTVWTAGPLTQMTGWVELLAGDPAAAEGALRPGVETLREIGELSWLSTTAAILAEAVYAQSRYEEAELILGDSEEAAGSDDAYSQVLIRGIKAKLIAQQGRGGEAVRLAREAVEIAGTTDFPFLQTFALSSLAEVLRIGGRGEEAEEALAQTIRVAEQKGYKVAAERARGELASAVTR